MIPGVDSSTSDLVKRALSRQLIDLQPWQLNKNASQSLLRFCYIHGGSTGNYKSNYFIFPRVSSFEFSFT